MGVYALTSNVNGSENTATGLNALATNTSGNSNTAMGVGALSDRAGTHRESGFIAQEVEQAAKKVDFQFMINKGKLMH